MAAAPTRKARPDADLKPTSCLSLALVCRSPAEAQLSIRIHAGRYLEFNLLYDRGVKFGLDGSGRVESIMVSAPPLIAWRYNVVPAEGSPEAELVDCLRNPRQWV